MKQLILTLALTLSIGSCQQPTTNNPITPPKETTDTYYELYPTKNMWTFLKLDTRNGKIWQVHFTISENEQRIVYPLYTRSLVSDTKEEVPGRFALYPTENIYNLLLLDKINGNTYQVQWNSDPDMRCVLPITPQGN